MAKTMVRRQRTRTRLQLTALDDRVVPSGLPSSWDVRGSGGGGALFAPAINPTNPNEYTISSDMSQVFHSTNAGASWNTIDFRQLQGGHQSRVYYTNNPNVRYTLDYSVVDGYDLVRPSRSTNGGQSWQPLANDPTSGDAIYFFVDPNNEQRLLISNYTNLYFSNNGGASWSQKYSASNNGNGLLIGGAFWDGSNIYLGTNSGLLVSNNDGAKFKLANVSGIPSGQSIISLAGAKAGGITRLLAVTYNTGSSYATLPGYDNSGGGQVITLDVGASSWTTRNLGNSGVWPFYAGMASGDINTLYVAGGSSAGAPTVYKSGNGGASWSSVFNTTNNGNIQTGWSGQGGDRGWGYGEMALGFTVDSSNPNRLIITDYGFAHASTDGGTTWKNLNVSPIDLNPAGANTPTGKSYHDSGLTNTTSWQVHWANANTMFIANSDIRGQRSTDGGQTFGFGYSGHTRNSMYRVVTGSNGVMYGAAASVHDLYQSTYLTDSRIDGGNGAVLMSTNQGQTWATLRDFGKVVAWVATDPTNANRLYAAVVHSTQGGIYVTNNLNDGAAATWTKLTNPPRTEGHPFNIVVLNDGTLVVSYSGRRNSSGAFTASSGIFVSTDGGQTWADRSHSGMQYWTKDIIVDPHDSTQNTWYAGVFSGWGGAPNNLGGLYKSTNRGQTWTRILTLDRVTSATFNPNDPNELFLTTEGQGLWYSNNIRAATPTFSAVANYPFRQPERVFFNPHNNNEIWVTSFGGGVMVGTTNTSPVHGSLKFTTSTASVAENGGSVTVTVTREGGSDGAISVDYATSNGTAIPGSDYTSNSGTLTWANGDNAPRTITIPIVNDSVVENSETFQVVLANATGGATLTNPNTVTITINDDDVPPVVPGNLRFSQATTTVSETGTIMQLTVERVGGSDGSVSVSYGTTNGTALAGLDYTTTNGTLTWANGDTAAKTITIPIADDMLVEGNETFTVTLSNPTNGATLTNPTSTTVTITDNDQPPPSQGVPFAVGTDAGTVATVKLFNADGSLKYSLTPFGTNYRGGVRVATGDVTGDGVADVVMGSNGSMKTTVRVLNGATGTVLSKNIFAAPYILSAASVAVGDVTGDGVADIAVGTDESGGRVRLYRGGTFSLVREFVALPSSSFWGRTQVAMGDVNADGRIDLVVSGQYPSGVRTAIFRGQSLTTTPTRLVNDFTIGGTGFAGAAHLAVGDVNGDGYADIGFGAGSYNTSRVRILSGQALSQNGLPQTLAEFAPPGSWYSNGVRLALRDWDGDGLADILAGAGNGRGSRVRTYSAVSVLAGSPTLLNDFDAFANVASGVWVG